MMRSHNGISHNLFRRWLSSVRHGEWFAGGDVRAGLNISEHPWESDAGVTEKSMSAASQMRCVCSSGMVQAELGRTTARRAPVEACDQLIWVGRIGDE